MKLLMKRYFLMLAIAISLLLAACKTVRYDYHPPQSDQGRMCITQCQGIREVCHGNESNRVQAERHACEQRSESTFRSCQRLAANKEEAKKCSRPACYVTENFWRCDENYRQCFVGCGGTIQKYEE
jgi:hypothetical protein